MPITSAGPVGTASYLGSGHARTGASTGGGTGRSGGGPPRSAATLVTLSAAAQTALAEATISDLGSVIAQARAALDALHGAVRPGEPLAGDGRTIDLAALDRRALYAVMGNGGERFTADEQAAAARELAARFAAAVGQHVAVARLTGDRTEVYRAALAHMQGAGPEEKASTGFMEEVEALRRGYEAARAAPGRPPAADDPVTAFMARADAIVATENLRNFTEVAKDVRTALDLQAEAAESRGLTLVYGSGGAEGRPVDLSLFDNRALSAIALDHGDQFRPEEMRAAQAELAARARASLAAMAKHGGAYQDPRAFSLGLISSYARMSPEERRAMSFTASFRDLAVDNYQSTAALMSMLQRTIGGGTGLFA